MNASFTWRRLCEGLLLAGMFLSAGCTTTRVDWASRVGVYTFDNAVVDLGPPDKQAKLQDETVVAEWMTTRGGTFMYPSPGYGYHYQYWDSTPPLPRYIDSPDYYLRLTFGPDGRLQAWKKFAK
jgi:hypothetical protein